MLEMEMGAARLRKAVDHHLHMYRDAVLAQFSSNDEPATETEPPLAEQFGDDTHPSASGLEELQRMVMWEVNIARGCLQSFNRMLQAHAVVLSLLLTAALIGFLQPPKGWDSSIPANPPAASADDGIFGHNIGGFMFEKSVSVKAFAVANSVSLYFSISGLLFYLYCSNAAIVSLVGPADSELDKPALERLALDRLDKLRAALRRVVLPSIKRRCRCLFTLLASSLTFSVIAFICGALASTHPKDRLFIIVIPAIPGCMLMVFFLYIAGGKLHLELDYETRFTMLWTWMARELRSPGLLPVGDRTTRLFERAGLVFPVRAPPTTGRGNP